MGKNACPLALMEPLNRWEIPVDMNKDPTNTFVFDLDGAMVIAVGQHEAERTERQVRDKLGDAFLERHRFDILGYPHYLFPGYFALLRWLNERGVSLAFFSSGVEQRNVPLVEQIMRRTFADQPEPLPSYRVFSRHHCIDTGDLDRRQAEGGERYQPCFSGNLKKKLAGVVVPEDALDDTLLIDDDESYMVRGEEYHFVGLRYAYRYINDYDQVDGFANFHAAFYVAGLADALFRLCATEGIRLRAAARRLQYDAEGAELSEDFRFPSRYRASYYLMGRDILRQIEPGMDFFWPLPDPFASPFAFKPGGLVPPPPGSPRVE